jgi:hypothetical protein
MEKTFHNVNPDTEVFVSDSVTVLDARHRDAVLVAASHGGEYAAYLAVKAGVRAVVLNDAGVGLDGAGIGGLAYLDGLGIPGATVSTLSARIGDGEDTMRRGVVSHVNRSAAALGCAPGQAAAECARLMRGAAPFRGEPPARDEGRRPIRRDPGAPEVWALDSAALVRPEDAGRILVVGSHGGAPGGLAKNALKVDALAAVFHDAGIGIEGAGLTRLPFLDARGIPAATVAAASARIGDGLSLWETGVISRANDAASRLGVAPGMGVPEFAALVAQASKKGRDA